jgi:asparagine synthase (glutamine-hydrolysing)
LRNAANGLIPNDVLWRRDKVGFDTPQDFVLDFSHFDIALMVDRLSLLRIFRKKRLIKVMKDAGRNLPSTDYLPWRIINLAIWLEVFDEQRSQSG